MKMYQFKMQLFDLQKDRGERRNLIDECEYREVKDPIMGYLDDLNKEKIWNIT